MRRFIVEVVVDAILLGIIILFLSLIEVAQPFPFGPDSRPIVELQGVGIVGFLIWAGILVLVNRFARPVLVALTGRLLFSTLGLFVVVINAFALWLTSVISPVKIGIADLAQPVLLWIIVAAALYTLLSTLSDASWGSIDPISRPTEAGASGGSSSGCRRRVGTRSSRTSDSSRSTTRSTRRASTSRWRTRRSGASGAGSPGSCSATGRSSTTRAARPGSG